MNKMCNHTCMAKIAHSPDEELLCTGSRNHGCKGCFCRTVHFTSHHDPCQKCGKYLFDLLDDLWYIQSCVYTFVRKNYCDSDNGWKCDYTELYRFQRVLDYCLNLKMKKNVVTLMKRSELVRLCTKTAVYLVKRHVRPWVIRRRIYFARTAQGDSCEEWRIADTTR